MLPLRTLTGGSSRRLLGLVIFAAATSSSHGAGCECLTADEFAEAGSGASRAAYNYGVGCFPHDANSTPCDTSNVPIAAHCDNIVPTPASCVPTLPVWCPRSWCYVEEGCDVANAVSKTFEEAGLLYSYAACGEPDFFTSSSSTDGVRGRVLRVAFRQNTGGFLGSVSIDPPRSNPLHPTHRQRARSHARTTHAAVHVRSRLQRAPRRGHLAPSAVLRGSDRPRPTIAAH